MSPEPSSRTPEPAPEDIAVAPASSPLTQLLDGQTLAEPRPLSKLDAVELLDFMADLSHGATGAGPESIGAAIGLRVLGHYLGSDPEGRELLDVVRRATAYESAAERRAPSAATANQALEGLNVLSGVLAQEASHRYWIAVVLPTPIHARYALSLLVESSTDPHQLFEAVAEHLVDHEDAGEEDREYVDRLRALLGSVDA